MLAYHDKKELKDDALDKMRKHRRDDKLARGIYWDPFSRRGCAVGCLIESNDHFLYEHKLGISVQIAFLEDVIFENLPDGEYQKWPERFLQAIPVGADLSLVYYQFMAWLMGDQNIGAVRYKSNKEINHVASLFENKAKGISVTSDQWILASSQAIDSYEDAYRSTGFPFPHGIYAAYSASYSVHSPARWPVRCTINSAYRSIYDGGLHLGFYEKISDKLIDLLENSLN